MFAMQQHDKNLKVFVLNLELVFLSNWKSDHWVLSLPNEASWDCMFFFIWRMAGQDNLKVHVYKSDFTYRRKGQVVVS